MGDWNRSLLLVERRGGVIVPPIDIGESGSKKETAELASDEDEDDAALGFEFPFVEVDKDEEGDDEAILESCDEPTPV